MSDTWFRSWFGEDYLRAYGHRDEEEARLAVDLVLAHARVDAGPVLDLACGAGRHLARMRERGLEARGLDLSLTLLRLARARDLEVVRADMRDLPFADHCFSLVTSFFTSFGYFATPEEDRRVLDETRRVLRPAGAFAFDFLNAERVRDDLVSSDEGIAGDSRIVQTRSLVDHGRIVEKRIEIHHPDEQRPRVFFERVRLYGAEELDDLLDAHGLVTQYRFGDYRGEPLTPASPRVIFIGRSR